MHACLVYNYMKNVLWFLCKAFYTEILVCRIIRKGIKSKMARRTFRGGVHPIGHKELTKDADFELYLPKEEMVYPLNQHIGRPASPVVKKGDAVLAGQIIAEASAFVSANVVSSCSGKVKAVEKRRSIGGSMVDCIVIENDGLFENAPGVGEKRDPSALTNEEILGKIKDAGIIGMGGAGFPTHVKLAPKNADAIRWVIANGAECEPYITCDDRLMRAKAELILQGMDVMLRLFPNAEASLSSRTTSRKPSLKCRRRHRNMTGSASSHVPSNIPREASAAASAWSPESSIKSHSFPRTWDASWKTSARSTRSIRRYANPHRSWSEA